MASEMPSWEEWNEQLSNEQRQYSLYKILQSMNLILSQQCSECKGRLTVCEDRFTKLEKRKWIDRATSGVGGVVGGFLAVMGLKFLK